MRRTKLVYENTIPRATRFFATWLGAICLFLGSSASYAQPELPEEALARQMKAFEQRLLQLERQASGETPSPEDEEITKLRLEMRLPEPFGPSVTGLGPAASRIYSTRSPMSLGGFGDLQFTGEDTGERQTNLTRFNLLFGSRFSDNIIFNSSLSFQNGGAIDGQGAARVEYAYLDFLLSESFGLRAGNILIPVGVTNLRFEPTLYPMVIRPRPEQTIIPTTWHENGLLVFGTIGSVMIQTGLVNSGDILRARDTTWIRAGRQGGSNAKAQEPSWFLRVDNLGTRTAVGASLYGGKWNQGDSTLGNAQVLLGEAHAELNLEQFTGRALYTEGRLSDTDLIYARTSEKLGSKVRGSVLILSYDILPDMVRAFRSANSPPAPTVFRKLPIFVSWEMDDVQADREASVPSLAGSRTDVFTFGANFKPHEQVAIKADFAYQKNNAGASERVVETAITFAF